MKNDNRTIRMMEFKELYILAAHSEKLMKSCDVVGNFLYITINYDIFTTIAILNINKNYEPRSH